MSLTDEIKNNNVLLVVFAKSDYIARSLDVLKSIIEVSQKVCFTSFSKPYASLIQTLQKDGLDVKKFFFIDVLTKTVQSPKPVDNCEFIQSPDALTDISLAFSLAINDKECDNALFDSITTMQVHQDKVAILKFIENIVTKTRVSGKKCVLIALREDGQELVKDLTMFVDKIVVL